MVKLTPEQVTKLSNKLEWTKAVSKAASELLNKTEVVNGTDVTLQATDVSTSKTNSENKMNDPLPVQRPMRVTDVEAQRRVCPMALTSSDYGLSLCRGSECMAWRWVGKGEGPEANLGFCGMTPHFPSR